MAMQSGSSPAHPLILWYPAGPTVGRSPAGRQRTPGRHGLRRRLRSNASSSMKIPCGPAGRGIGTTPRRRGLLARSAPPDLRRRIRRGRPALPARCRGRSTSPTSRWATCISPGFSAHGSAESALSDYRRDLDLDRAVALHPLRVDGVHLHPRSLRQLSRPGHCRPPDSQTGRAALLPRPPRQPAALHHPGEQRSDTLVLAGRAPVHVDAQLPGATPDPVVYDDRPDGEGMRFEIRLLALCEGGSAVIMRRNRAACQRRDRGYLAALRGDQLQRLRQIARQPGPRPGPAGRRLLDALRASVYLCDLLRAARGRSPGALPPRQPRTWAGLAPKAACRTDERIRRFPQDAGPALAELLFQYGRYLLIASSRPGTPARQPAGHLEP